MIVFMTDAARKKTGSFDGELFSVTVQSLGYYVIGTVDLTGLAGNRQAPFVANLRTGFLHDLGIDEFDESVIVTYVNDEYSAQNTYLRCCDADSAVIVVHGIRHIIKKLDYPGGDLIYGPGFLAKERISFKDQISKCHLF